MNRTRHTGSTSRLGYNEFLEMVLRDYKQASHTLDRVALTFRTRESQLHDVMSRGEEPSFLVGTVAPVLANGSGRMSRIAFFTFGKFRAEAKETSLEIRAPTKAMKILKFLVQRRSHHCDREVLAEALWPECEPKSAFNGLRVAVHTLRQAFAKTANMRDIIVYQGGSYELNPKLDVWVDADVFEKLWHQGARFDTDGHRREAVLSYEQAELLYQGEYLEEDAYEEWTLLRRESLRDGYLHLLGKLADWCFEKREYANCISRCHKILAEDPYREDTYRLLMRSYAAMGQKATALHWYEVCYATLRKGLDVDPSLKTISVHRQVMAADL